MLGERRSASRAACTLVGISLRIDLALTQSADRPGAGSRLTVRLAAYGGGAAMPIASVRP
jgi:hypothetical protein